MKQKGTIPQASRRTTKTERSQGEGKTPMSRSSLLLVLLLLFGSEGTSQKDFVGVFQRYWGPKLKNVKSEDILTIKEEKGKLVAVYDGVEDFGEHGPAYFRAEIRDISFNLDSTISFSMPSYELYGEPVKVGGKQEPIGVSRPRAEYTGRLQERDIVFTCISKVYDCPEPTMLFKRVK